MKKRKICVYAICKDEEPFVDRWMDSMGEADAVVVTDTGSKDHTVEKLRARGAIVFEEAVIPWRFDTARNLSLSHLPDDTDIAVCTDLDEVFVPGWRKKLESAWQDGATMGNYLYNWSLFPDGTPDVQFYYFKVHAPQEYTWVCPVHECLRYTGKGREKKVFIPGMELNHLPDDTKPRGSYLPLLEMAVKEDPLNERMQFYLGREYSYSARWQECIQTLQRYLSLPGAAWEEERGAAMRLMAAAYMHLGQTDEAYRWYYRAVAEVPGVREGYVEFARAAYAQADWPGVFFGAKMALSITEKSTNYINMGYAWDHTPHDLAAIACFHLGLYREGADHAQAACRLAPADERLRQNLAIIKAAAG